MSRLFILLLADWFGTTYADTGLTNKPVATSFPAASQFPFSTSRATSCAIDLLCESHLVRRFPVVDHLLIRKI